MSTGHSLSCSIPDCGLSVSASVIIDEHEYYTIPATSSLKPAFPLIRFNLCGKHLEHIGNSHREIKYEDLGSHLRLDEVNL